MRSESGFAVYVFANLKGDHLTLVSTIMAGGCIPPVEIEEKRRLYFEAGAVEVWTCDLEGHIRFYEPGGERSRSGVVPSFPTRIEV